MRVQYPRTAVFCLVFLGLFISRASGQPPSPARVKVVNRADSPVLIADKAKTLELATGQITGQINGNQNSVTVLSDVDVSAIRTIRLYLGCFGTTACSGVMVEVATAAGNVSYDLDQFLVSDFPNGAITKSYEVPGTAITVNASHTNPDMLLTAAILGR